MLRCEVQEQITKALSERAIFQNFMVYEGNVVCLKIRLSKDKYHSSEFAMQQSIHQNHSLDKHSNPNKKLIYMMSFWFGAGGGIRTPEGMSQQIYSLPCLTASLPLRKVTSASLC